MKYTGICSAYMQLSIRRGQVVEGERLCEANFHRISTMSCHLNGWMTKEKWR